MEWISSIVENFLVFFFFLFSSVGKRGESWKKNFRGKLVLTLAWCCNKSASISLISICFTAPRRRQLERNHQQSVSFSQQPTKLIFSNFLRVTSLRKIFSLQKLKFLSACSTKTKKKKVFLTANYFCDNGIRLNVGGKLTRQ